VHQDRAKSIAYLLNLLCHGKGVRQPDFVKVAIPNTNTTPGSNSELV
jgi:hypothetical protein